MILPKITSVKIERDEGSSVIAGATYVNLIVKVMEEILEKAFLYDFDNILIKDINNKVVFSNDSEKDFTKLDYRIEDINDFIKEVLQYE